MAGAFNKFDHNTEWLRLRAGGRECPQNKVVRATPELIADACETPEAFANAMEFYNARPHCLLYFIGSIVDLTYIPAWYLDIYDEETDQHFRLKQSEGGVPRRRLYWAFCRSGDVEQHDEKLYQWATESGWSWEESAPPETVAEAHARATKTRLRLDNDVPSALRCLDNLIQEGLLIRYNVVAGKTDIGGVVIGHKPQPLQDADTHLLCKLTFERFKTLFSESLMHRAIEMRASDARYNPPLDDVNSDEWDETKRCETVLIDYFGADDTPLIRAMSRKFLCAIVQRIKQPGCKWDYMPVLASPGGGWGKSTFFKDLTPGGERYFSDNTPFDKDERKQLEMVKGKVICEAAEMARMKPAGLATFKAFCTRTIDNARWAYGHHVTEWPRTACFVGTIDRLQYLIDDPNQRRFWPVDVKAKYWPQRNKFLANRSQILAEAAVLEPKEELFLPSDLEKLLDDFTTTKIERAEDFDDAIDALLEIPPDKVDSEGRALYAATTIYDRLGITAEERKGKKGNRAQKALRERGFQQVGKPRFAHLGRTDRAWSRPSEAQEGKP